jgi:hypothetical protein
MRSLSLTRLVSFRVGLLLLSLGLLHQVLSHWWIRYFHLTGHVRFISIDFVSGFAIGLGVTLLVSSYGGFESRSQKCLSIRESDEGRPGTSGRDG